MQKGFAHLFVLSIALIVFGVGIGGWYYFKKVNTPKCGPMLDQYKNAIIIPCDKPSELPEKEAELHTFADLNFELKTPQGLKVLRDSEEGFNKRGNGDFRKNFTNYIEYEPGKFLGAVVVLDETNSYESSPLTVWVFENPDNLGVEEWYKNYWYYPFVWGDFSDRGKIDYAPKMDATVSGQLGKSGIIDYQPGKPKFIYLSNNKKMYLFRVIGESGEQVLSSVRLQ